MARQRDAFFFSKFGIVSRTQKTAEITTWWWKKAPPPQIQQMENGKKICIKKPMQKPELLQEEEVLLQQVCNKLGREQSGLVVQAQGLSHYLQQQLIWRLPLLQ